MNYFPELTDLLGAAAVSIDPRKLQEHSGDKWFASHSPDVVVEPETTKQVSLLLEFAQQKRIAVTPRGAGYGYVGGCVPERGGISLSLIRMNQIKESAVNDGVAVVQPGVITGQLQEAVRPLGLFSPPYPPRLNHSSFAGISFRTTPS